MNLMDSTNSTAGLNKISGCDNPNRTTDVIFIHGLDGDAFTTWERDGKPENFWPQWLGEELPNIGVWSLGYAVSSNAWKGSAMPLTDRAINALDQLELDGIGHYPIVFICHSLGGLLVKQMLRHAYDFNKAEFKRIADQTRGIVFLSTPHSGSGIANWINYLGILLRPTVSMRELQAHHPGLRDLNNWFRHHPKTPETKILVYCEKIPLKGLLVVDETSADPHIQDVIPIPMDDDHVTICKPKDKTSQVYRRVKKLVKQIGSHKQKGSQLEFEIQNAYGVVGFLLSHASAFSNAADSQEHASDYFESLIEECSQMQILGMEQPIPLDDIYTEVRIVKRVKARRFKTIDELYEEAKVQVRQREYGKLLDTYFERKKRQAIEDSMKNIWVEETKKFEAQYQAAVTQLELSSQAAKIQIPENIEPQSFISKKVENLAKEISQLQAEYKKLRDSNDKEYQERLEQLDKELKVETIDKRQYHTDLNNIKNKIRAKNNKLREKEVASISSLETEFRPLKEIYDTYSVMQKDITKRRDAHLNKLKKESQNQQLDEKKLRLIENDAKQEVEVELEKLTKNELTNIVLNDFGHLSTTSGEVKSAWNVVLSADRALILGQPGAGKTTFFKHVAQKHATDNAGALRLPIYVVLRRLAFEKEIDLLSFIANDFKGYGFEQPDKLLDGVLRDRRECLLIFDGLDEVSTDEQERIVSQIVSISKRFKHNKILVSCRTANYRGQLEGFFEFEVCAFSKEQINQFVAGWFKGTPLLAGEFLKDLSKNPGLQELATTPLFTALLCIAYKRNQKFPDQKALVYLSSIDALLIDWDSSKQVRRTNYVQQFDAELKKQLLGKVACDTFCEKSLYFSKQEIISRLNEVSKCYPIQGNQGPAILKEYVLNHGLLIERAKDIFSFSHLSIQEFLTAFYLSHFQSEEIFNNLASESYSDPRWNEVVVFLGGVLSRADILLVCLRNKMKEAMAYAWFKDYFIGGNLPQPIAEFITLHDNLDTQKGWEAWFRWRYFEYNIHKASYGQSIVDILEKIQSLKVCENIAKASKLDKFTSHNLDKDKPANTAFKKAINEAGRGIRIKVGNDEDVLRYANLASNVVRILSTGARVDPVLKWRLLIDIGDNKVARWGMPVAENSNILGV